MNEEKLLKQKFLEREAKKAKLEVNTKKPEKGHTLLWIIIIVLIILAWLVYNGTIDINALLGLNG